MAVEQIALGKKPTAEQGRDAVHVAIVPVLAVGKLYPGQEVGIIDLEQMTAGVGPNPIGIVDPFLKNCVVDELFWLVLYPNTITSLRHEWLHPAFPVEQPVKESAKLKALRIENKELKDQLAAEKNVQKLHNVQSITWLQNYAASLGRDYSELISATNDYLDSGKYWPGKSAMALRFDREFWGHFEKATGRTVPEDDRSNFFSCSC